MILIEYWLRGRVEGYPHPIIMFVKQKTFASYIKNINKDSLFLLLYIHELTVPHSSSQNDAFEHAHCYDLKDVEE